VDVNRIRPVRANRGVADPVGRHLVAMGTALRLATGNMPASCIMLQSPHAWMHSRCGGRKKSLVAAADPIDSIVGTRGRG
jgi:hypothetical protein